MPLVLSRRERAYLQRQVRRRRVVSLLLSDAAHPAVCSGLLNKSVAVECDLHKHPVGRWCGRSLKDACLGFLTEPPWADLEPLRTIRL